MTSKKNLAKVLNIDKSFRIMKVAENDDKKVFVTVKRIKSDQCRICGSKDLTIHDLAKKRDLTPVNGSTKCDTL